MAAVLFSISSASATENFTPPVRTDSGLVQGTRSNGLDVYKGIPFAAPPVGRLRWRPPQAVAPWQGIRMADRYPPECLQTGAYPEDAPPEASSEDCLYLNIWQPASAPKSGLPVMVWIYGGGLANGSASTPLYRGDVLARQGVIVVTANYRLGVFGFLALRQLAAESPHHSSGDYGLLDQIAALKWIHRNIAAFGGDPHRVTIFGQSSGAISLSVLSATSLTRGLFQRAIAESGGLFEPLDLESQFTLAGAEHEGSEFMVRAGAASLQALRSMPAAALMKIPFNPSLIIDGYALKRPPYDVYRDRRQNRVPLLIGSNADEGALFTKGHTITRRNLHRVLEREGFPGFIVWLLDRGKPATDAEARAEAITFNTDLRFRWDMRTWARLAAKNSGQKVFLYQFDRAPPFPKGSVYAGLGATHGMELPYVFGHLNLRPASWTAADRRLSEVMVRYWINFAGHGDPNGPGVPRWPAYTRANGKVMYFGRTIAPGPERDLAPLIRICRFYSLARLLLDHWRLLLLTALSGAMLLSGAILVVIRKRDINAP